MEGHERSPDVRDVHHDRRPVRVGCRWRRVVHRCRLERRHTHRDRPLVRRLRRHHDRHRGLHTRRTTNNHNGRQHDINDNQFYDHADYLARLIDHNADDDDRTGDNDIATTIDDLYDDFHAAIEHYSAGDFDNLASVRAVYDAAAAVLTPLTASDEVTNKHHARHDDDRTGDNDINQHDNLNKFIADQLAANSPDRTLYDAAAAVLGLTDNDEPDGFDHTADLWAKRAAYIDAHAMHHHDGRTDPHNLGDARAALCAALRDP